MVLNKGLEIYKTLLSQVSWNVPETAFPFQVTLNYEEFF